MCARAIKFQSALHWNLSFSWRLFSWNRFYSSDFSLVIVLLGGLIDPSVSVGNKSIQSGIPEEAFNLECHDLELKAAILQQFILLDGKYVERLNQLEEDHTSLLR